MPGLFTTLTTAADTLDVCQKILSTIGNNISNSSTPGYAKQRITTVPLAFDPQAGLAGGVTASQLQSSRNEYAESAVWRNGQAAGRSEQLSSELQAIEPLFDVTGDGGVPAALNKFFASVSSWTLAPNDTVARQAVLDQADQLAQRFNENATGLANASQALDERIRGGTDAVNQLTAEIGTLNTELRNQAQSRSNPALDAQLHSALESLSECVDFTALKQSDGSFVVLLGGGVPLAMGDQTYAISADTSGGTATIRDAQGNDITADLTGGKLGALVTMKNDLLPDYTSRLNALAASVADGVNNVLAAGIVPSGNAGAPLFSYNLASDAAFTLGTTGITADQLAAALPGASGGNGNALNLVALGSANQSNGMTFTQSYAEVAARVGQAASGAEQDSQTQNDLLVQARSMRDQISTVSLNEEAALLMQYQRAYQATARLITTLDNLTGDTINMMQ